MKTQLKGFIYLLLTVLLLVAFSVAALAGEGEDIPSLVVTTLDDVVDSADGVISLREAIIYAASGTASKNWDSSGGSGSADGYQITFDDSLFAADGTAQITLTEEIKINTATLKLWIDAGQDSEDADREVTVSVAEPAFIYDEIDEVWEANAATVSTYRVFNLPYMTEANALTLKLSGLALYGGDISGNGSTGAGSGGVICSGDNNILTLKNCGVYGGKAYFGGGAYFGVNSALTVTNSIVSGNTANFQGGGIYANNNVPITLSGSTVSNNTATSTTINSVSGGGIYGNNNNNMLIEQGSVISGNIARSSSEGNNCSVSGGGIYGSGTITVRDSEISDNQAIGSNFAGSGNSIAQGGGIDCNGTISISGSTVSGNNASNARTANYGGGIYGTGAITIKDSVINNNKAGTGSFGGGIYAKDELTILNSTLSGNSAAYSGGAVVSLSNKDITIINSTIAGNTVTSSFGSYVGGISCYDTSDMAQTITVVNSIILGNYAGTTAKDIGVEQPADKIIHLAYSIYGTITSGLNAASQTVSSYSGSGYTIADVFGASWDSVDKQLVDADEAPLLTDEGLLHILASGPAANLGTLTGLSDGNYFYYNWDDNDLTADSWLSFTDSVNTYTFDDEDATFGLDGTTVSIHATAQNGFVRTLDLTAFPAGAFGVAYAGGSVPDKEITGYTALSDVELDTDEHLTTLASLKDSGKLPTSVTVTDGTTPTSATITNWTGTYTGGTTGTYTLEATWTMPTGYADAVSPISVTVDVVVNTAQTEDGSAATVPNAPNVTARVDDGSITVRWSAPDDGGSPILGYIVQLGSNAPVQLGATTTNYTFSGLSNGRSYIISVIAVNDEGNSDAGTVRATPTADEDEEEGTENRINTDAGNHGKIRVSDRNPDKGDNVTITIIPDDGYQLDELTITDRRGREIKYTDNGDNTYTFKHPGGKVDVKATFKKASPEPAKNPFTDINGHWAYNSIIYMYQNNYMNGISATLFAPELSTNRSMVVTILWRLAGEPAAMGNGGFNDVAVGQYYTQAVAWAVANNIVTGYNSATFGTDDNITREQLVAILYRFAQYMDYDVSASKYISNFPDAKDASNYAQNALAWAYAKGLIGGRTNGSLDPGGNATRAEIAAIIQRFVAAYEK